MNSDPTRFRRPSGMNDSSIGSQNGSPRIPTFLARRQGRNQENMNPIRPLQHILGKSSYLNAIIRARLNDIAPTPSLIKEYKYKKRGEYSDKKADPNDPMGTKKYDSMICLPVRRGSIEAPPSEAGSYDESEYDIDPRREKIRFQFQKCLYAVYFAGILISFKLKHKIIADLKQSNKTDEFLDNKRVLERRNQLPFLPTNDLLIFWNILMVIMITLTLVLTPFRVSFISPSNKTFENLEIVFDVFFGIDIIVTFLTAHYDQESGLTTDLKEIAMKYLYGMFCFDFMAILPLDSILRAAGDYTDGSQSNKLFRLARLSMLAGLVSRVKIFKLNQLIAINETVNKIFKRLTISINMKKMGQTLLAILYLNHLVGCLWFFVAKSDQFNPDTWVSRYELVDSDPWSQYVASFYWAFQTLTTVGYGDITPLTNSERIIAIFWMMVGVGVYSFTIGFLSDVLEESDKKTKVLKNKLMAFSNFASQTKLPDFLRIKVQRYIELNHRENVLYWMEPKDLQKVLPHGMKTTLLLYSYFSMIKDIKLLQIDANFTAMILTSLRLLKLKQKELLYREEDPAQEVYFINKGGVKLVSEDGEGIFSFVEGTCFGEIELLNNTKRICFAQATQTTTLFICDRGVFMDALSKYPKVMNQIKRAAALRQEKIMTKLKECAERPSDCTVLRKRRLLKSNDYFHMVILKQSYKSTKKLMKKESNGTPSSNSHGRRGSIQPTNPITKNPFIDALKKLAHKGEDKVEKAQSQGQGESTQEPIATEATTNTDSHKGPPPNKTSSGILSVLTKIKSDEKIIEADPKEETTPTIKPGSSFLMKILNLPGVKKSIESIKNKGQLQDTEKKQDISPEAKDTVNEKDQEATKKDEMLPEVMSEMKENSSNPASEGNTQMPAIQGTSKEFISDPIEYLKTYKDIQPSISEGVFYENLVKGITRAETITQEGEDLLKQIESKRDRIAMRFSNISVRQKEIQEQVEILIKKEFNL